LKRNWLSFIVVTIAGEAIFFLPFVLPRLFRPYMIDVWSISNTDIGLAFSAYGVSAMASYLLGGPLADNFSPRKLIAMSLLLTATASVPMLVWPSAPLLIATYFVYGITTIFLMWGALLKLTHDFGHQNLRSTAMGLLDAGRGLFAAIAGSTMVLIISFWFGDSSFVSHQAQVLISAYVGVIALILIVAIAVWATLRDFDSDLSGAKLWSFPEALLLLKRTDIWLLGAVVMTAYCGYKSIDYYVGYLVDVQEVSALEASRLMSHIFWMRPIGALFAGLGADRLHRKLKRGRFIVLVSLFGCAAVGNLGLCNLVPSSFVVLILTLLLTAGFTYALRALYFSVFGEMRIPGFLVGTTVGIVSLVGFLPDFFFGALTGFLLDQYPGALGYRFVFGLTSVLLFLGAACTLWLGRRSQF
jgi:MFS family permease